MLPRVADAAADGAAADGAAADGAAAERMARVLAPDDEQAANANAATAVRPAIRVANRC